MFGIGVDLSEVIDEFGLMASELQQLTPRILERVVDDYMFKWEENINNSTHTTRNEYKKAMYVDYIDDKNAVIGLTPTESQLALMLEEGASGFDIREGMEKSSKRHFYSSLKDKKEHWYITIPLTHATPSAVGESFSSIMPKAIEDVVKQQPMQGGKSSPVKIDQLPEKYQEVLKNKTTQTPHKAPIYAGIIRIDKSSTKNENRGGYMTFRRISDNSEEGSWQHPGFAALKLMEKTAQDVLDDSNIDNLINDTVQRFLDKNR